MDIYELWCYRIIGAVLIVVGLYLVLWGKNEEKKFAKQQVAITSTPEHSSIRSATHARASLTQPLLPSSTENVWSRKTSLQATAAFSGMEQKKNDTSNTVLLLYVRIRKLVVCMKGFSSCSPFSFFFFFFG